MPPDAQPTAPVATAPEAASPVVDAAAQTPDVTADGTNTGVQAPADTSSPKVFKPMRGRAVAPVHVAVEGAVRDEARRASEAEAAALRAPATSMARRDSSLRCSKKYSIPPK